MTVRPSAPLDVAVWGVGRHARARLLPALAACPAVRLAGVYTRDAAVRAAESSRWRCRAYDSDAALLADPAVAVVVIATPNALHKDQALAAIAAGKHVWCEKPLACAVADAETMAAASRRRGVALAEILMYPHHGQFRRAIELAADGTVGRPRSIAARLGLPDRDAGDIRYRADLGGGALLDAAIYPLSFVIALAGAAPSAVAARIERDAARGVDVGGAALLGFGAGVSGVAEWGYGRFYRAEAEIWGERGVLIVPRPFSKRADEPARIVVRTGAGERAVEIPAEDPFVAMFAHLAAAIGDAGATERLRTEAVDRARLLERIKAAAGAA